MRSIFKIVLLIIFSTTMLSDAVSGVKERNNDEFSFANTHEVVATHLDLDLMVNFSEKKIVGTSDISLKWLKNAGRVVLDIRDLSIKNTYYWDKKWIKTTFEKRHVNRREGQELYIKVPFKVDKVRVEYATSNTASGLQWLTPEQTAGKKYPFMFSQSQAIHARSWIPLQDTPAVRVTFNARVKTDLPLIVVMGADNEDSKQVKSVYRFSMPQAVPSYLIAIAVGDLKFQSMSKRTGIFAEPALLNSAIAEFNETEKMIEETEKLYGPYDWGRYDLLILPPSFPYGGMENPRLSFITPTVIAGDKSLVNLIAHELAHSWSGNLVTNANWRDLWINEGFTSYVENRIMEAVYGKERAKMEQVLAYEGILEEMKGLNEKEQSLYNRSDYSDPDAAFSGVPYTKGQLFLHTLELAVGRETLDAFLRQYFSDYAFKSISTEVFIKYLDKHLLSKTSQYTLAQAKQWIYEGGLPKESYRPMSDAFTNVEAALEQWIKGKKAVGQIPFLKMSVHEKLHFINNIPTSATLAQLEALDSTFKLTDSSNAEIAFAWYMKSIKLGNKAVIPFVKQYLARIGRMKLIVPLYEQLAKDTAQHKWLGDFYRKQRAGYHPIAQVKVERKLQSGGLTL